MNPAEVYGIVHFVDLNSAKHWSNSVATAVALAESGGDPNAHNASGATGLFQIMPATARGLGRDPAKLKIPSYNVETAHLLWQQRGWRPWSTVYDQNSGRPTHLYEKYLPDTEKLGGTSGEDIGEGTGVLGIGIGPDIAVGASERLRETVSSIPKFLGALSVIFHAGFWLRALFVLGGALLLFFGVKTVGMQYVGKIK